MTVGFPTLSRVILKGVVGSTAYGLAHEGSDKDYLSCHVSSVWDLLAWGHSKHQETIKSTDPDLTSHDVGKFTHLVLKGNPTVTELLWLPKYEVREPEGDMLIATRNCFLGANNIRQSYGGYAMDQINRLVRRGDSFSSDTAKRKGKHARHCFRLLLQGAELLRTALLRIELTPEEVKFLWYISDIAEAGQNDILFKHFESYYKILNDAYDQSYLPAEPDRDEVRKVLIRIRSANLRVK